MIRELFAGVNRRVVMKALRDPGRAVMRLVLRVRLMRTGAAEERRRYLAFLSEQFRVDGLALAEEYAQSDFRKWFRERKAALARYAGPKRDGTTGDFGCEAMYLLVRAARPKLVVETGVLYGASTAHILTALDHNGAGKLCSIEIGRSEAEPPHDFFIPEDVKHCWELVIGDSRRELPAMLGRHPVIDMFHHDSLHTFDHMTWEFTTVFPHLRPGGVLSSDDVQNPHSVLGIFRENAFASFCRRHHAAGATFFNLGVVRASPGPLSR